MVSTEFDCELKEGRVLKHRCHDPNCKINSPELLGEEREPLEVSFSEIRAASLDPKDAPLDLEGKPLCFAIVLTAIDGETGLPFLEETFKLNRDQFAYFLESGRVLLEGD
jgi:hypothetical protein